MAINRLLTYSFIHVGSLETHSFSIGHTNRENQYSLAIIPRIEVALDKQQPEQEQVEKPANEKRSCTTSQRSGSVLNNMVAE